MLEEEAFRVYGGGREGGGLGWGRGRGGDIGRKKLVFSLGNFFVLGLGCRGGCCYYFFYFFRFRSVVVYRIYLLVIVFWIVGYYFFLSLVSVGTESSICGNEERWKCFFGTVL